MMDLSITKISDKERIKAFKVGSTTVGCLLPSGDVEDEAEARLKLKEIIKEKRKQTKTKSPMDLMSAKQEAIKASKKSKKAVYINVDKEGECHVKDKADASMMYTFKGGKEIPLSEPKPEETVEPVKSTKKEKVTNTKTKKEMKNTAKKSAKKVATKKTAKKASKKSPAKKVVRQRLGTNVVEVKGASVPAAIKEAIKQGLHKAKLIVGGKTYGLRVANTWSVVKSVMEIGKDGYIIAQPKKKGFYLYTKADYKVFASIFASHSYKDNGAYAQSTVPSQYEAFFKKF